MFCPVDCFPWECRHIFIDVEWGNIIINRSNWRISESNAPQRRTHSRLKWFLQNHQPRIEIQLLQNSHQTAKTQQSQRRQQLKKYDQSDDAANRILCSVYKWSWNQSEQYCTLLSTKNEGPQLSLQGYSG